LFWPTIPLADLIDNRCSACIEWQVTDWELPFNDGEYMQTL